MRIAQIMALIAMLGSTQVNVTPVPANLHSLFVLHDGTKDQWCGYHEEQGWRSDIDRLGAFETASVEFSDGYAKIVKFTEADDPESGDWIVYDKYEIGEHGAVLSLERTTNILPGDISRKEVFELRDGRLVRKSVAMYSLKTNKQVAPKNIWFPKLPLAKGVADLPFSALLNRIEEVSTRGTVCVPSPTATPSAPIKK